LDEQTLYEVVGTIAPLRYFDPNDVLLDGTYDLFGAVVLLGMTLPLIVGSHLWFVRRDI